MDNRPWSIWWDFKWNSEGTMMEHIVIETNHPKYNGELYRYDLDDVTNKDGYIDYWIDNVFVVIESDLTSGRVSISKIDDEYFEKYKMRNL